MNGPVFLRNIRQEIRSRRLRLSGHFVDVFTPMVPDVVPSVRDVTWLELRRMIPAILAEVCSPELARCLSGVRLAPPSNFAVLKGLVLATDPGAQGRERLIAAAEAVCSLRYRWLVSAAARSKLLDICEGNDWDEVPGELALAALRKAFGLRRKMRIWWRLLGELARAGRLQEISVAAYRHPGLAGVARTALQGCEKLPDAEPVFAAELIALARSHGGNRSRNLARKWLLPLVTCSTGRFFERTSAARCLSEQLLTPRHVAPLELAEAIERGISPAAVDDYSNVRKAFSPATWEQLHGAFKSWAILTELECFACEHDRMRFWRHIASKGARN